MVGFRLREGDLFVHTTNSVFAGLPFPMVALQDPAPVFALQKLGWHVRDEGPLQEVFEQFENIGRSSHRLTFLFMKPPRRPPFSAGSFRVAFFVKKRAARAVVGKKRQISTLTLPASANARPAASSTGRAHRKIRCGPRRTITS
jgi:hypothetical protein